MRLVVSLVVAATLLLAGSEGAAQTSYLPPPAASSLDRIAQAPLSSPPPTWDAYAPQAGQVFPPPGPSGSTWAPSALSGQPGYPGYSPAAPSLTAPPGGPQQAAVFPTGYPSQSATFQQTMHVFQGVRGSWAYLMGDGNDLNVGVNELDTTATFALPFFHNSPANINHAPLLITPGFGLQLWDGPETSATQLADLPPSTYDVFLDAAWNP
jgi:hypothetical protein